MKYAYLLPVLVLSLLLLSCNKGMPPEPVRDNPLDVDNPDTHGDPYHLTAVIGGGGIALSWNQITQPQPVGYNIYRRVDEHSYSLYHKDGMIGEYTDTLVQNGHRYSYYVIARGAGGEEGDASNVASVSVDADPALFIEGENVVHTPTRNVTLTILAYGADKMLLSNEPDLTDAQWENYSTSKNWQLKTGAGTKTVYLRVVYAEGDTSDVITDSIEPAPLTGSFSILPEDSAFINHREVRLSFSGSGAAEIKVSNTRDSAAVNWQPYTETLDWTLTEDDGLKRVYAWFRNDFFPTVSGSDSVNMDTQATIASFNWTSTGGDMLVPGDEITFILQATDDAFGTETGGTATVTVAGWDPITLDDTGDGSYLQTYTITNNTPGVNNALVIVSFTDRARNDAGSVEAEQRLTCLSVGIELEFQLGNSDETITMVWIPAGEFMMGSPEDDQDRYDYEDPRHPVTISEGFWLGKYEVTQQQWEAVMGDNPAHSYGVGDDFPVYYVSWNDIHNDFLTEINATEVGNPWCLPSEAQWEYACRAGTTTRFYWGDDPNYMWINYYAVYIDNDPDGTAEVGTKLPNAWGLYDMSGNVVEWVEDDWHNSYNGAHADESPWIDTPRGASCVTRGGSWGSNARGCRSANRSGSNPTDHHPSGGFRLMRSKP